MRLGEIVTAGVLALLSGYFMWKSAELPIGYVAGTGPGGGAWPFWLSAIMLGCCVCIAFNWRRRASPPSRSEEPVLSAGGWRTLGLVGGGVVAFVALVNVISMYGAVAAFLLYYTRFLGRHSLPVSLAISILFPAALFFFFEGAMRISMPTGLPFMDPVFDVLYEFIY